MLILNFSSSDMTGTPRGRDGWKILEDTDTGKKCRSKYGLCCSVVRHCEEACMVYKLCNSSGRRQHASLVGSQTLPRPEDTGKIPKWWKVSK